MNPFSFSRLFLKATRRHHHRTTLATLLLGTLALSPAMRAETTAGSGAQDLTPTGTFSNPVTAPIFINNPGTYYLSKDINSTQTSSTVISIRVSNVTLDLNGHTISNTSNDPSITCEGVNVANSGGTGVSSVTIRNGTIMGFYRGVMFSTNNYSPASPSYGHLIENLNLVNNFCTGAYIAGANSRAYRCRVILTGGTSVSGATNYFGFLLLGANHTVEDCDVVGKSGSSSLYGVFVQNSNVPPPGVTSGAYYSTFVVNNRLSNITYGIATATGSNGSVKYRDNLTANIAMTAYPPTTNNVDALNNN